MHLGEVLVVWDPGEWYGISSTGASPEVTAVVGRFADRVAAEVDVARRIVAVTDPDAAEDPVWPVDAVELARAVRCVNEAFAKSHG
ncbi:hypothetical protein ACIBSV_36880 [Embleya sp. NPDC050154]|uniref:hypothetical protein n=1 Tax=Embleya sp. NPDC050154 TaxID=3363988 RepID=UPI003791286B